MDMRCFDARKNLLSLGLILLSGVPAIAQSQVFAYPNAGQSEEQQSRDRFECHQWSVSQTGFDPSTAPPLPPRQAAPPPPPTQSYSDRGRPQNRGFLGIGDGGFFEGGGMMGDAATGAALGAAGGAIAGNAGQGAAIGALASTVFGAVSRSSSTSSQPPPDQYQYQQQQYYQQQQAQADQAYLERADRVAEYNRAYGACMQSREYTVN
jgi:hypothetical protein